MKFNLKDFLELDTKSLLAVNGGTDCSGSSSPSSPSDSGGGGSGGPGSSTTSSYSSGSGGGGCSNTPSKPTTPTTPKSDGSNSSTSSGGGGCSGTISTPPTTDDTNGGSKDSSSDNIKSKSERKNPDGTITKITSYDDGTTITKTYDAEGNHISGMDQKYCPKDTKGEKTQTGESVTTNDTTSGDSNSLGSTDTTVTESGTTNTTNDSQTDSPTTGIGLHSGVNGSTTSNPSGIIESGSVTSTPEVKTSVDKIMEAIKNKGDNSGDDIGEMKKAYIKGVYQCDEYVEEMLTNAGYDAKKYYVDNPSGKTVDTHISELQKSEKKYETDCTKLTEGVYVVFMADEQKKLDSHAALMFVNSDGSSFIYDNSSRNFYNGNGSYDGGIEKTKDTSVSNLCGQYSGYENFYFQKL